MKTKILVQGIDIEPENRDKIIQAARHMGVDVQRAKYVPVVGGIEAFKTDDKIEYAEDDWVIFFGTINMYRYLQKSTNWQPLGWVDWDKLSCQTYYDYLGRYLIDPYYKMMPLREIGRRKEEVFRSTSAVFIRPIDNEKSFTGQVVDRSRFDDWFDYITRYEDVHGICVIAKPSTLLKEYRLVIADRKVIAGSQYMIEGALEVDPYYPKEAAEYAEEICEKVEWQPAPVYCMDIAETIKGFRLIEIGGLNVAGLYDCDVPVIVEKAVEIAEREWREIYE